MDDREVQSALVRYAVEKNIPVSKSMRMSARRIAVNLTYETEPRGFDGAAEASGKKAILGDLRKVYATATQVYQAILSYDNLNLAKAFYAAMKNGEIEKAREYLAGSVSNWKNLPIGVLDPSVHQSARASGGRVRHSQKIPAMIVAAENFLHYLDWIQARSGLCASAWAQCATKLGSSRGIPGWKKGRHGVSKTKSNVIDQSTSDAAIITMENLVPYVDRACDERKMERVVRREEEVLLDLIERALQAAARRAGF